MCFGRILTITSIEQNLLFMLFYKMLYDGECICTTKQNAAENVILICIMYKVLEVELPFATLFYSFHVSHIFWLCKPEDEQICGCLQKGLKHQCLFF